MRALLFLAITVAAVAAAPTLPCPSQYQLIEGRCIRALEKAAMFVLHDKLPDYRAECAKDGAHLPVIKNDEENQNFADIVNFIRGLYNEYLVMDMVCNTTSRRLEWADGSPITYSPNNSVDFNFDCVSTQQTAICREDESFDFDWYLVYTTITYSYVVLCDYDIPATTPKATSTTTTTTATTTAPKPTEPSAGQCGDYSVMDTSANSEKHCIKVYTDPISWNNASQKCAADFASLITINSADENKYLWRTALSNNILEGMHIGAHQSSSDPSVWTWVDGDVPFGGKTYDNFMSSFPIPGVGECSSMLTENPNAYWINENCDDNYQPFICRRADFSSLPKTCPSVAPKAGEDIFPPGFPNADTPCEYMLFVAANKLVELEVITLVADDNKDFLEILEGTSGPHLLANLTGTILAPTKFTTTKSNVLRVNWAPGGSGSGRGFRIRYNQLDV